MRNNSLAAALVGVLLVCGLFTTWISVRYYFSLKELQRLQAQVAYINTVRKAALDLAGESLEYSKRQPAIVPLLQQFQIIARSNQPPAAAAVPKPTVK